jgi:lipid-A-disaccharide synthase
MRIAIVAGEPSGDLLGAGLIKELKARRPDATFEGVGGPAMLAEGFDSLYPLEELSVMGLVEVLRHLPKLLRIRRALRDRYLSAPPDVFIGIDSPDFTLGLERQLREGGVRTVHYVSPSVWAWRQGRLEGIRRSVDLMLTLFPFESAFYERSGIEAAYVGHPAADRFPLQIDSKAYRAQLGLQPQETVVALLPGSRAGEVARLGPVFAAAAKRILEQHPTCRFVAPMVNERRREQFAAMLDAEGVSDRVTVLDGRSEAAMAAADCVLLASGTATLEAMLLKRPMVVGYRVAPLTAALVRKLRLVKIKRFALPNLLAGEDVVPELIQEDATAEQLAAAVVQQLNDDAGRERLQQRFMEMHRHLRRNASSEAAEAILRCLA